MTDTVSLKQHSAFRQFPEGEEWLCIKSGGRVLYGAFQIKAETAKKWNLGRPHKALVITVSSGPDNTSRNLLGNRVVFQDDLLQTGELLLGHFAVQLDSLTEIAGGQEYFIVASLNSMLSNVETLKLETA